MPLMGGTVLSFRPGPPVAAVPMNVAREALQAAKRLKADLSADKPPAQAPAVAMQ